MRYLILSLFLISCTPSNYIVESDYSYKAKFHLYKTFDFADVKGFEGTLEDSKLLKKYIGSILTSWGYRQTSKKPDLYIYYSVFYDEFQMKGYNQQELRNWSGLNEWYLNRIEKKDSLGRFTSNLPDTEKKATNKDDQYNPFTRKLKEGTIFISFYDRRKKLNVWQGYASGYFGKEGIQSERILRSAVISILDEFRLPSASI